MGGRFDIFDLLSRRMDWLGQRQSVLAKNIAHADTPGYLSRDLKPDTAFKRLLRGGASVPALAATDPRHITSLSPQAPGPAESGKAKERYETSPVGNGVVLEEQLVAMNQTSLDYQTVSSLYGKQKALFRIALGSGNG